MTPREKANARAATYRKKHRDKILIRLRNCALKRNYGIDLEQYNKLFEDQQGCCKICVRHSIELNQTLHVDHCHKTGVVRGLLCSTCNSGLGHFQDNPDLLKEAINYLGASP